MQIKDENNRTIEISFSQLSQICGCNIYRKNYVMKYIAHYFSKKKYCEDELEVYHNQYPEILLDGEQLSRSRYECTHITSIEDIENELSFFKDSTLYKYISNSFETTNISESIQKIDDAILQIANDFESNMTIDFINNIKMNAVIVDKDKILKNFIFAKAEINSLYLKYVDNFAKLKLYLAIEEHLLKTTGVSKLILISNIEKIVKKEVMPQLSKQIENLLKYNAYIMIESNEKDYILGSIYDLGSINILANINVYLPNIHVLTETINRNYPINKYFDEREVYEIVKRVANMLFDSNYAYGCTKDDIIIKILNKFYDINCNAPEILTTEERSFLQN